MVAVPEGSPVDRDVELMMRIAQGDNASFATLLNLHRPAIVHFIYRKVRNVALAEDLSQEVFLRVYRARGSYRATAKFRTWLFRIATNLAINAIRDAQKYAWHMRLNEAAAGSQPLQIADGKPTVEERLVDQMRFAEVREAIAALPPLQSSAVRMQRYQDMNYAEIAGALGCSEPAVKSLLFRAHETLRQRLGYLAAAECRADAASELLDRIAS